MGGSRRLTTLPFAIPLLALALAILAAFVAWITYQLLAQHGRLLVRIETLESTVAALGKPEPPRDSLSKSRLLRTGLPPGSPAPDFELPCVTGDRFTLSHHRGSRVLLVFSDPQCGPCHRLLPDLQRRYRGGLDATLVMISRGDVHANARVVSEFGLTFPVALQRQWEISRLYGMFATPIAFLIDENGVIAEPVAVGVDQILALLPLPRLLHRVFARRRASAPSMET